MEFLPAVKAALAEDRSRRDVTSRLFLPPGLRAEAVVVSRAAGAAAGVRAAAAAFRLTDPKCLVSVLVPDGRPLRRGGAVLKVRGRLAPILAAERTALNILCHLSGIATLTREFVRRADGRAAILDTRKTLPGLRDMEKWAVLCGGGKNHRRDLSEAVLVKENHLDALGGRDLPERLGASVRRARRAGLTVEMEARDRKEVLLALHAGADILLLDNFPVKSLPKVVRWIGALCREHSLRRPLLEVSGGVTLETVASIARSGVDRISVGRLTHSAPALDLGLDVKPLRRG